MQSSTSSNINSIVNKKMEELKHCPIHVGRWVRELNRRNKKLQLYFCKCPKEQQMDFYISLLQVRSICMIGGFFW